MRLVRLVATLFLGSACSSSASAPSGEGDPKSAAGSRAASSGSSEDHGQSDGGVAHASPNGNASDAGPPDDASFANDVTPSPPPVGAGHVLFRLSDGHWHRLLAQAGNAPEDVTSSLDAFSGGSDDQMNVSKDGAWLVSIGSRFGCSAGSCLARFRADLTEGEPVTISGSAITTGDGRPAVASDGNVIVYPARGPHALDLYAIKRAPGGLWGTPVLLTGASSFDFHHDVAIAWDGSRVVCDCGADEYGAPPTSICEVNTDGSGFHQVLGPADGPDQSTGHALHHADYTPEGDIVFEADWPSEQVWKISRGSAAPVKISPANEGDDNSPCALPDGRIVSLWLGRPGNTSGGHEIKAMNADGSGTVMLLTDVDVVDIGMGCGN
jgi:hypothetical protein